MFIEKEGLVWKYANSIYLSEIKNLIFEIQDTDNSFTSIFKCFCTVFVVDPPYKKKIVIGYYDNLVEAKDFCYKYYQELLAFKRTNCPNKQDVDSTYVS